MKILGYFPRIRNEKKPRYLTRARGFDILLEAFSYEYTT